MSTIITRAPAGIPSGGQFSRHAHTAAPSDMLSEDTGSAAVTTDDIDVARYSALQAKEQADLAAVKKVSLAIRSQWPDSEHAFARIEDDGSITMTHVLDAFEGLHADEQDLSTRLGDGTDVHAALAGVSATGDWTTNTAKPMLHGGPPNQKTLRIDLYEAAALRTAPEQLLDLARDEVSDQVLAQYPDADSWEADFEWSSADERFTVADDIYVSAGNRYGRINLRDQDPALLGELTEAAHGALTDIDEDTRYCAQITGPYATATASF